MLAQLDFVITKSSLCPANLISEIPQQMHAFRCSNLWNCHWNLQVCNQMLSDMRWIHKTKCIGIQRHVYAWLRYVFCEIWHQLLYNCQTSVQDQREVTWVVRKHALSDNMDCQIHKHWIPLPLPFPFPLNPSPSSSPSPSLSRSPLPLSLSMYEKCLNHDWSIFRTLRRRCLGRVCSWDQHWIINS